MAGPIPAWWHLTALCTGAAAEAIGAISDVHDELQWEGSGEGRSALVSVRYLAQTPTLQGVLTQGLAAMRRTLGETATDIEPTALFREEDGAVFDPDDPC